MSRTNRVTAGLILGAVLGAIPGLYPASAHAGPCSSDIAQFEAAVRQSAGNPYAGLTARQSISAQLDRQPTPDSVRRSEKRLKSEFSANMARAKRLDARGDAVGCKAALDAAKKMYIL